MGCLASSAGRGSKAFLPRNNRRPPPPPPQAWVEAFFAPELSGMRDVARQVKLVEPPIYAPFSRANSTLHLTFSYDSDIYFRPLEV